MGPKYFFPLYMNNIHTKYKHSKYISPYVVLFMNHLFFVVKDLTQLSQMVMANKNNVLMCNFSDSTKVCC